MGPQESSPHLTTMSIVAFIVPLALKSWLDNAVHTGRCSEISVRRGCAITGFGLVAMGSVGMVFVHQNDLGRTVSPWVVTMMLDVVSIGLALQTFACAFFLTLLCPINFINRCCCARLACRHIANYFDLTESNTGVLMGVGNTIATIPSFLSPKICAALMVSCFCLKLASFVCRTS